MSHQAQSSASPEVAVASAGQRRIGYFTIMSGALLLVVLAGFSGTLYLRPFGASPPLSGPLYVHGAVLTAWFMLLGSIVIVAPALSRIFYTPAGTSGPATPVVSIALLLTVVVYDLFEQRRPHGATLSAFGLMFLLAPAITWALIETGVWPTFVRLVS